MSMFDYDTRPITPQVVLVGNRASSAGYTIRDFLSRNGVPYDWVDLDDAERVRALVSPREMDPGLSRPVTRSLGQAGVLEAAAQSIAVPWPG